MSCRTFGKDSFGNAVPRSPSTFFLEEKQWDDHVACDCYMKNVTILKYIRYTIHIWVYNQYARASIHTYLYISYTFKVSFDFLLSDISISHVSIYSRTVEISSHHMQGTHLRTLYLKLIPGTHLHTKCLTLTGILFKTQKNQPEQRFAGMRDEGAPRYVLQRKPHPD